MIYKKLLTPAVLTALLVLILAFVFVRLWSPPLRDRMNEIFALAIYGLLVASYLLRIALIFFGVFAVYRTIREQVNGQEYKRVEVKLDLK